MDNQNQSLKAVLILGTNLLLTQFLIALYHTQCLMVKTFNEDGTLDSLFNLLKGRVNSETRIDIVARGNTVLVGDKYKHQLLLNKDYSYTQHFLSRLSHL